MKLCPACRAEYFDDTLEFCLQDGSRLELTTGKTGFVATAERTSPNPESTLFMNVGDAGEMETIQRNAAIKTPTETEKNVTRSPSETNDKIQSEYINYIAPITALAHNWWQWVYLEKQFYSNFTTYFFSANFLMWFALTLLTLFFIFLTLRKSSDKKSAYFSLVILAINILLFIVPRR